MGQRPAEFTPADRRDVHEEMWRNALKFQKPRSFSHSGKARASSSDRSTAAAERERVAAVTSSVYRVARRYEWNAPTEVAQATSFAALDARRNAHAAARGADGGARGVRRSLRRCSGGCISRPFTPRTTPAARQITHRYSRGMLALSLYPTL